MDAGDDFGYEALTAGAGAAGGGGAAATLVLGAAAGAAATAAPEFNGCGDAPATGAEEGAIEGADEEPVDAGEDGAGELDVLAVCVDGVDGAVEVSLLGDEDWQPAKAIAPKATIKPSPICLCGLE